MRALVVITALIATPAIGQSRPPAFAQCASCHSTEPGKTLFGPSLHGVAGRKAGSLPGFAYSPGMKASGLVWNQATLTAFLRDPGGTVPGTKMRYWGVGINEQKVADLLAYLAAQER